MFKPREIIAQSINPLPLCSCLAKTRNTHGDEGKIAGRSVYEHSSIVGSIARLLIERLPQHLRDEFFPSGSALVSASHDVGKISPTFQKKIYDAIVDVKPTPCELKNIDSSLEINWGGHAGVSQLAIKDVGVGGYIPEIVGQHHGSPPPVSSYMINDTVFGGEAWQQVRIELLNELKKVFGEDWPNISGHEHALLLSGLTTVSDWIGSGAFFDDPEEDWRLKIEDAVHNAGYVKPIYKQDLSFRDIFRFPPRETQAKFISACKTPGVYILEAPMGLGKTEAALYAAYKLLLDGATGIYFALPTQLTSDKIHERLNSFLNVILDDNCQHKKALLLHGNAWLKQTELGEEGQPCGSWFQSGKRGILAPFAAGTIDQALMAVMNVKHGFVRAYGLMGKVVILDEVHSYDAYTGTILDTLVESLRKMGCIVIILSATLTSDRRKCFLSAEVKECAYPLISAVDEYENLEEITISKTEDKKVDLKLLQLDSHAIQIAIEKAKQGQQVLWIENTVADAQRFYKTLAAKVAELDVDCGLLHSKFIRTDRDLIEGDWVNVFGKNGADIRGSKGRILVGTQVLEQSLDIDADFLVTRVCPTDMLLQRLGRLWRHDETLRPDDAKREAIILTPSLDKALEDPLKAFGSTAKVYSPYVLIRSLKVWCSQKNILIPGQIRDFIEASYSFQKESGAMLQYHKELEAEKEKLQRLALVGLSRNGKALPESKASTRYGDIETCDVLLLKSFRYLGDCGGVCIELLSGETLELHRTNYSQNRNEWRNKAVSLMQNIVKVSAYQAPAALSREKLDWLQGYMYVGNKDDEEGIVRVGIVKPSGEVVTINSCRANENYVLAYSHKLGYEAKKVFNKE